MGKRFPDESFEDYRARLKSESKELKKRLNGEMVWNSAVITSKPEDDGLPEGLRPMYKVRLQGTYRKPKKEEKNK